ncbi:MAG: hypothetical protein GXO69_00220 [Acidobacteria bacterium]|nr:hypothetical protein [Acidobacteriota bacterium]
MSRIWVCLWLVLFSNGISAEKIIRYNPDTVRSFSGKILKVEEQHWYGKKPNYLFVVAPDKNLPAIIVDGGLASLYTKKPAAGNRVRITGSFVKTDNGEIVLSRTVTVFKKIIKIRMENGVPVWVFQKYNRNGRRNPHSFIYRRMRHGRH